MKYPDAVLLVFAKAPVPGKVNTRLIPEIGEKAATDLQSELIHSRLNDFTKSELCEVQLWCAPDCEHECFKACANQYGIQLFQQHGVDLGQKMSNAIENSLQQYKQVVIVGTDAPALTMEQTETAINALNNGEEIVLVPAEDGGYVLIGMSRFHDKVFFSVPWGTDRVLTKTRGNIIAMGKKHKELDVCWDIDRVEDYERYLQLKKN